MELSSRDDKPMKWRVDRSINLTHLLSTLSLALAVVLYATNMDKRVSILEAHAATATGAQKETDRKQDDTVTGVRDDLKEIGRKLDRLLERSYNRKE